MIPLLSTCKTPCHLACDAAERDTPRWDIFTMLRQHLSLFVCNVVRMFDWKTFTEEDEELRLHGLCWCSSPLMWFLHPPPLTFDPFRCFHTPPGKKETAFCNFDAGLLLPGFCGSDSLTSDFLQHHICLFQSCLLLCLFYLFLCFCFCLPSVEFSSLHRLLHHQIYNLTITLGQRRSSRHAVFEHVKVKDEKRRRLLLLRWSQKASYHTLCLYVLTFRTVGAVVLKYVPWFVWTQSHILHKHLINLLR